MVSSVYPSASIKAVRRWLQREESPIHTVKAFSTTGIYCEVKVILANLGDVPFAIARGDRIAQLVPAPVQRATLDEVASLDQTMRGAGGFGSSRM